MTLRRLIPVLMTIVFIAPAAAFSDNGSSFETLFRGNGDVQSYIYFHQDNTYFIDTDLNVNLEMFRYKRFYFLVDLYEETSMGRKYHSNMVFDPNRGHWSFGVSAHVEFEKYFLDGQFHHDCFHDVGRYEQEDFSIYWNSPRIGFGSLGYLPKYKYHQPQAPGPGLVWQRKLDYYVLASFFGPRGNVWQKHHDYEFTLTTNLRLQIVRYKRLGIDLQSDNLWVMNQAHNLKRKHGLAFNLTIYGNHGALVTYFGWWPYDSQAIRNRDGKTVFGIHLGF